jgi:hypothetical protein
MMSRNPMIPWVPGVPVGEHLANIATICSPHRAGRQGNDTIADQPFYGLHRPPTIAGHRFQAGHAGSIPVTRSKYLPSSEAVPASLDAPRRARFPSSRPYRCVPTSVRTRFIVDSVAPVGG